MHGAMVESLGLSSGEPDERSGAGRDDPDGGRLEPLQWGTSLGMAGRPRLDLSARPYPVPVGVEPRGREVRGRGCEVCDPPTAHPQDAGGLGCVSLRSQRRAGARGRAVGGAAIGQGDQSSAERVLVDSGAR